MNTKTIWEQHGFHTLTPIQDKTQELIKEGTVIVAISPTGTGKTLAYVVPILERVKADKTLQKVIVPQAFRIAIPPLSNVVLDMIKGSSLVAMISLPDIFQNAKIVGGREQNYMTVYILVAIMYWVICLLFEQGLRYLEKKLAL